MWRLAFATDSGSPENFGLGSFATDTADRACWFMSALTRKRPDSACAKCREQARKSRRAERLAVSKAKGGAFAVANGSSPVHAQARLAGVGNPTPICRMIFPPSGSISTSYQMGAGSGRPEDYRRCSQEFGRSAVEYTKSRAETQSRACEKN
jgi:hypothetical protein